MDIYGVPGDTAMSTQRSREELTKFLNYVGTKGLLSPATVESRKASVNKVLGILSEDEAKDVASIDLDEVMRRFANLHGQQYTADSLRTYKSRTKSSIDDFVRYVENPMGFKVGGPKRQPRAKNAQPNSKPSEKIDTPPPAPHAGPAMPAASSSIIPIAIRADVVVHIQGLPLDLTPREAKKISNVVLAMAMDES
jgi:hypothetical protein